MTLPRTVSEAVAATAIAEGLADAVYATQDGPLGTLLLVQSRAGLARIAFDGDEREEAVLAEAVARLGPRVIRSEVALAGSRDAVAAYLAGAPASELDRIELDFAWVTGPFRRAVLETLLREVGPGETIAYGALAARAGTPGAARAVGTAMSSNPLPIVVPCHRVLPSTGRLGAYAGGAERKRILLELEGSLPPGS